MTKWNITTAYKYDLASVCNLFTQAEQIVALHQDAYQRFEEIILARPNLVKVAKSMYASGFDPRVVLISVFDLLDHMGDDIHALTEPLNDRTFLRALRDYYVFDAKLIDESVWTGVEDLIPALREMAAHLHESGFRDYWHNDCLPHLASRCREYREKTTAYPIVEEINNLLGESYHLPEDVVTVYVCMFSAPFGTSLRSQAFVSDQRWDIETTVATALHELMHPPFGRDTIGAMAEILWQDAFFQEAFNRQPSTTTYNTHLRFLEENLVEAAHVYLANKLGAIEDPLRYFITHDNGTHVVSPVVFAYLAARGDNLASFEQAVQELMDSGVLGAGNLRHEYMSIYRKAGLGAEHPYCRK